MLSFVGVLFVIWNYRISYVLLILDFKVLRLSLWVHLASFNLIKVCFYCICQLSRKRLLNQIVKTSLQELQKRWMLQKILCAYSFFGVLLKAFAQNHRHIRRDPFRHWRALLLDDVGHSCERIQFEVWRLASQKFDSCTPKRPNITGWSHFGLLVYYFRSHPIWSSCKRHILALQCAVLFLVQDHSHPKVCKLDPSIFGCQDVASFDVSMNHIFRMQKLKPLQDLLDIDDNKRLWNLSKLFDDWIKRAILDVFEHDIQMIFGINAVNIFHNLRMFKLLQQIYLCLDRTFAVFFDVAQRDLLDRYRLPIPDVEPFEYLSTCSSSQDISNLVWPYHSSLTSSRLPSS